MTEKSLIFSAERLITRKQIQQNHCYACNQSKAKTNLKKVLKNTLAGSLANKEYFLHFYL